VTTIVRKRGWGKGFTGEGKREKKPYRRKTIHEGSVGKKKKGRKKVPSFCPYRKEKRKSTLTTLPLVRKEEESLKKLGRGRKKGKRDASVI